MKALVRAARRLHLMAPAPRRYPARPPVTLDYVEFMEGVASPDLAAFVRQGYEQEQAQIRRQAGRRARA